MNEHTNAKEVIPMKRWMKPSTINFFKRNPNISTAARFTELSSESVVKIMSTGFEVLTHNTHYITTLSRSILSERLSKKEYDDAEIWRAEQAIENHLASLKESFLARKGQAEQKIELAGDTVGAMDVKPLKYETKIVTAHVTSYLEVLQLADQYLSRLDHLWKIGELSNTYEEGMRAKLNAEREVRLQLHSITRVSNKHFTVIKRICNEVIARRREERLAQSEKDKQAAAEKKRVLLEKNQKDMDKLSGAQPVPGLALAAA